MVSPDALSSALGRAVQGYPDCTDHGIPVIRLATIMYDVFKYEEAKRLSDVVSTYLSSLVPSTQSDGEDQQDPLSSVQLSLDELVELLSSLKADLRSIRQDPSSLSMVFSPTSAPSKPSSLSFSSSTTPGAKTPSLDRAKALLSCTPNLQKSAGSTPKSTFLPRSSSILTPRTGFDVMSPLPAAPSFFESENPIQSTTSPALRSMFTPSPRFAKKSTASSLKNSAATDDVIDFMTVENPPFQQLNDDEENDSQSNTSRQWKNVSSIFQPTDIAHDDPFSLEYTPSINDKRYATLSSTPIIPETPSSVSVSSSFTKAQKSTSAYATPSSVELPKSARKTSPPANAQYAQKITNLTRAMHDLEQNYRQSQAQVAELTDRVHALKKDDEALRVGLAESHSKETSYLEQLETTKQSTKESEGVCKRLESDLAKQQTVIEDLRNLELDLHSSLQAKEAELLDLQSQMDLLSLELDKMRLEKEFVESKAARLECILEKTNEGMELQRHVQGELEEEIRLAHDKINSLREELELAVMSAGNISMSSLHEEFQTDSSSAAISMKSESYSARIQELELELEETRSAAIPAEDKIRELEDRNTSLREEVTRLQAQVLETRKSLTLQKHVDAENGRWLISLRKQLEASEETLAKKDRALVDLSKSLKQNSGELIICQNAESITDPLPLPFVKVGTNSITSSLSFLFKISFIFLVFAVLLNCIMEMIVNDELQQRLSATSLSEVLMQILDLPPAASTLPL